VLSMDDDFQRDRDINAAKASHSAKEGVRAGFLQFGRGLFDGITGLVVQPVHEIRESGASGVFTGSRMPFLSTITPQDSEREFSAWSQSQCQAPAIWCHSHCKV
jgi:hypothetical protein